jgi:hypothetical protein
MTHAKTLEMLRKNLRKSKEKKKRGRKKRKRPNLKHRPNLLLPQKDKKIWGRKLFWNKITKSLMMLLGLRITFGKLPKLEI